MGGSFPWGKRLETVGFKKRSARDPLASANITIGAKMEKFKNQISKNIIIYLSLLFFFIALIYNLAIRTEQHFSLLAESFLNFKTYFLSMPGSWADTSLINGQHYWPLGPFPAVLLTPFVFLVRLVGFPFYQGYLGYPAGLAVFYVIYLLSRTLNYSTVDRIYWAFAFCFVSSFATIYFLPFSWYFAQTVATLLVVVLLHLSLNTKKNEWLIGSIIALLIATRPFAALACVLFILFHTIVTKRNFALSIQYLAKIFIASPFPIIVFLWLLYNQISFGHFLATGYNEQELTYGPLQAARDYGLFNLKHIPGNLYYALISLPRPVYLDGISQVLKFPYLTATSWGTSLFFVSPYLFYLFSISYKSAINRILLAVSLITFIPIIMYYGIGFQQYGYRYALDFFPFLFLLVMIGYKDKYGNLKKSTKIMIITFAFINLWFFATIFVR